MLPFGFILSAFSTALLTYSYMDAGYLSNAGAVVENNYITSLAPCSESALLEQKLYPKGQHAPCTFYLFNNKCIILLIKVLLIKALIFYSHAPNVMFISMNDLYPYLLTGLNIIFIRQIYFSINFWRVHITTPYRT